MNGSKEFEFAIETFLNKAKIDDYELSIALENERKNITECCDYIIQKVKEKKVNAMTDSEVFNLAIEYYLNEEDIKIKKNNCRVVTGSEHPNPTLPKSSDRKNKQMSIFDLM
ncbi:Cas9 inhibitor AcrIIA9 family protein [Chryseobacterium sp. 5_R23647]|uniref:Cas9 inhibitor AcrIIA9 family protein n=1 Tax=Chryseobacterium sp. 5_R23647 TaxID=2258964 RepID=UPI000E232E7F|nr:Cas9 inhibitor AcrIIA9 family protein [Chryseobacterium sp. 5_R23647]REC40470.1 hypothetical protein DRF69_18425 [Chryseobacterium sp. 5_R23647]